MYVIYYEKDQHIYTHTLFQQITDETNFNKIPIGFIELNCIQINTWYFIDSTLY